MGASGHGGAGIEITSGGPGSNMGKCCGIAIGWKTAEGKGASGFAPFISSEDWNEPAFSHGKQTFFCGRVENHLVKAQGKVPFT